MQINQRLFTIVSAGTVIIILDQLTKWLVKYYLSQGSILEFWLFRLRLYRNSGIALGIPLSPLIFYPLFILLVTGFLIYFNKKTFGALTTYSSLILAAAFSNLIDRLRFGYVIDFIEFYPTRGPIFNLADIVIVVSILIIAWKTIKKY